MIGPVDIFRDEGEGSLSSARPALGVLDGNARQARGQTAVKRRVPLQYQQHQPPGVEEKIRLENEVEGLRTELRSLKEEKDDILSCVTRQMEKIDQLQESNTAWQQRGADLETHANAQRSLASANSGQKEKIRQLLGENGSLKQANRALSAENAALRSELAQEAVLQNKLLASLEAAHQQLRTDARSGDGGRVFAGEKRADGGGQAERALAAFRAQLAADADKTDARHAEVMAALAGLQRSFGKPQQLLLQQLGLQQQQQQQHVAAPAAADHFPYTNPQTRRGPVHAPHHVYAGGRPLPQAVPAPVLDALREGSVKSAHGGDAPPPPLGSVLQAAAGGGCGGGAADVFRRSPSPGARPRFAGGGGSPAGEATCDSLIYSNTNCGDFTQNLPPRVLFGGASSNDDESLTG
ncbi:hypothetical protein DIPPA_06939 [Diplonema papillatum]|nr:hypothetical protein DIPPA_06939 [Diplonema papillatum]|eukprot:gene23240-35613_t